MARRKPPIATCPSCDKWPCECSKPYCYQVGYGTCEESCFREFRSHVRLSRDELGEVVSECMLETVMRTDKDREKVIKKSGCSKDHFVEYSVQCCMPDNPYFVEAMEKRGFFPMEYEATFSLFGWCKLDGDSAWFNHCNDDEVKFVTAISRKLVEKRGMEKRRKKS